MQADAELCSSFFLLELPLEVITEVLKLLDWQTVLHVRQTCKHLSDATKAKSIWLGLFYASNSSHSRSPLRLERPMELYTSRELEYLVLRRSSAQIIRQRRTELFPALTRRFPIDDLYVGALILINGGRWLLTASATGSVWYHDLDARDPVKRLLIPEQMEHLHGFSYGIRMAVDIDNKSSLLSFNLAMVMARTAPDSPRTRLTQIWHVSLQLDGQVHAASLKATLLSCFHRENCGFLGSFSLLGKFIAFGVATIGQWNVPCYVALVDWAVAGIHNQSHRTSLAYPRTIIYYPWTPDKVQLLPGDRLLVLMRPYISLYDTSSFEATTSIPPDGFPRWPVYPSPTWKSRIPSLDPDTLSQTYLCPDTNTLRLVFTTMDAVHGLIIPGDAHLDQEPKVLRLMDLGVEMEPNFVFSYNSAIMPVYRPYMSEYGRASLLHMLDYTWPDDTLLSPPNTLTTKLGEGDWMERTSAFDEGSGRVVVCGQTEVVVLDFVSF